MLSVETNLHLTLTVAAAEAGVNDLAAWCFGVRNEIGEQLLAELLWCMQERHWQEVLASTEEIACPRCGVVHSGAGSVVRRGSRRRQLRTSSGRVRFRLVQVTCLDCYATWSPYPELLELEPRQRVSEELLRKLNDWATEMSYAKTTRIGGEWLGSSVSPRTLHRSVQAQGAAIEFTEGASLEVLVADSTRVPAGDKDHGEEACVALQIQKRSRRQGRSKYHKRVVGFGLGWRSWHEALATATAPELVVTDGEMGVHQVVADYFPDARHQQCEWHIAHSINQSLMLDGMPVEQRRATQQTLSEVLKHKGAKAREWYRAFTEGLRSYRRTHTLLQHATEYLLYPKPSRVRTTSLAEREMREINRRTDIGVRWSPGGVTNMLKLRLAKRLNPDDYARVWRATRPLTWTLSPHA